MVMRRQQINFIISVLLIGEHGQWTAQCLEFDITAQGESMREAMEAFEHTFIGQIVVDAADGKRPLEDFAQAPKQYWHMFEEAEQLAEEKSFKLPDDVPYMTGIARASNRVYA